MTQADVQVPTPPTPPSPPPMPDFPGGFEGVVIQQPDWWQVLPPPALVMIILASIAAATIVLWPVMRALARRLEGGSVSADVKQELEELRRRVHELEDRQGHVAELEDRVDFAERLLAQHREAVLPREGGA